MGRMKKWERSEKAKVKLKKKSLPKGLNVTDTSFKTRPIVVPAQLKPPSGSEPLSSKNLTVKDLLTRLNHHNDKARSDALLGLRELVKNHPEILTVHLQNIIKTTCNLLVDATTQIRRNAIKLLGLIFKKVDVIQVSPVFDVLHWTMSLAMTHINLKIQEDSLLIFDLFLELDPLFMAGLAHEIFPKFLNMISKIQLEKKLERVLTVNLKNKMTAVKWRIEVLNRISSFLRAIVSFLKNNISCDSKTSQNTIQWDGIHPLYIPIYNGNYRYSTPVPYLFRRIVGVQEISDAYGDLKNNVLVKSYIMQLFPLLFETWLEVGPGRNTSEFDEKVYITDDVASVLKCILEIIQMSWDYIHLLETKNHSSALSDWFKATYSKDFVNYFLYNFPYSQGDAGISHDRNRKRSEHQPDVDMQEPSETALCLKSVEHNLMISNLFVCISVSQDPKVCSEVSNYIQACLMKRSGIPMRPMVEVLRCLLRVRYSYWIKCEDMHLMKILKTCVSSYFHSSKSAVENEWKDKIFKLLFDLILDMNSSYLHNSVILEPWITSLAELLCSPTLPSHVVEYISKLACLNNKAFNKSFMRVLPRFLTNLNTVVVSGVENPVEGRKKLVNLLYWVLHWDDDNLQLLKQHMADGSWNEELCNHVKWLLYNAAL